MIVSIFGLLNHGVLIPTLELWKSTEVRQACKGIMVKMLPCLMKNYMQKEFIAISEKDKALVVAKEAAEWRRQQQGSSKPVPITDLTKVDVQIVEKTLTRLRSRQEILKCQRSDGDGNSSPTESNLDGIEVDRSYVVPVYDPPLKILHVKSVSNIDEHFQYCIKSKSEIILRCASLRPMENLDDPVHKIDCFTTSASTPK